jgi:hypothetical protein
LPQAITLPTFDHKWESAAKIMFRKNLLVIILLLALLLIVCVLWYYNVRIKNMEKKTAPVTMNSQSQ